MALIAIPTENNRHLAVRVKRPGERRSLSRSATRALDVLEAFGRARRPLRAVEIARLLDLAPSTANQLLKTMAESAHLLFDAQAKTYVPSPRLAAAGGWIAEIHGNAGGLANLVRQVSERTGLVATVTTPSGLFMQVLELAGAEGAGGERGMKVSLFGSAIGSAFLATLGDAEVRQLALRARVPEGEVPAILRTLATIRDTGHAAGLTTGSGIWSLALSLPPGVLGGRAVLGIAGPRDVLEGQTDRYCRLLHAAVDDWLAPGQDAPASDRDPEVSGAEPSPAIPG